MKHVAFHRLHLADETIISPAVVSFDEQDNVLGWHQLNQEEPFTEWKGGDFFFEFDEGVKG